ncbi:MAG: glycosyltransferase [Candidatus Falkowbacteria bacterium]
MSENKKIKIAYIVPSLDAGGAERFILDLISRLDRNLFSPTLILFSHGGFFVEEAQKMGIDLIILKKRVKLDLSNFVSLYRAVKTLQPDIVHTQLGGDVYGRLVAHLLKVPVIVSTEQNVQTGENFLINHLKKWTAKFADKIVAISEAVKKDTVKRYAVPESKLEVIYNGLEVNKFILTSRRPKSDKIILGSVGRLTRQKNYQLLIEALAELKGYNWECRLAGEGELRADLEQRITELKLEDRIKLVGLQKDVKKFLSDLDLFILPSLWEGLGIVVLEAGLAGLPVLASRVDGICEIIKDGQNGILFNSNDKADLVLKLKKILENISQPAMDALGVDLQTDIQAHFDIRVIVKKYQKLYLNLLDKK